MTDRMGAQPRNLDYYLQRMSGYSKNTIRIQPQSKLVYNAGDTIVFRLPTNSILDLHTLNLRMTGQLTNNTAGYMAMSYPRFTQSFIRRFDVTMGGMQAGLGSLHDYGFLYNLLGSHKIPADRFESDLCMSDLGAPVVYPQNAYIAGHETSSYYQVAAGAVTPYKPLCISSWLGIMSGNFMRFLVSYNGKSQVVEAFCANALAMAAFMSTDVVTFILRRIPTSCQISRSGFCWHPTPSALSITTLEE